MSVVGSIMKFIILPFLHPTLGMGTVTRKPVQTGLSIAVNREKPDLPLNGSVFYACTGFLEA